MTDFPADKIQSLVAGQRVQPTAQSGAMLVPTERLQMHNDPRPHFLNQILTLVRGQMKLRTHTPQNIRIDLVKTVPGLSEHGVWSHFRQTLMQILLGLLDQALLSLI